MHSGSAMAGHYFAYIKRLGSTGAWYKFNDEHVTSVSDEQLQRAMAGEGNSGPTPYMCLLRRVDRGMAGGGGEGLDVQVPESLKELVAKAAAAVSSPTPTSSAMVCMECTKSPAVLGPTAPTSSTMPTPPAATAPKPDGAACPAAIALGSGVIGGAGAGGTDSVSLSEPMEVVTLEAPAEGGGGEEVSVATGQQQQEERRDAAKSEESDTGAAVDGGAVESTGGSTDPHGLASAPPIAATSPAPPESTKDAAPPMAPPKPYQRPPEKGLTIGRRR
jgi:hypothetical protein